MKKILILLPALIFALSSCTKSDYSPDQTVANAISFVNLNDKVMSRAANDVSSDFGVYAIYHKDATFGNGWLMDNLTVDGKVYSYSPTKFWPSEGVIDFYSYAPASSVNFDRSLVSYESGSDAKFVASYSVPVDAQEDFTIAAPALGINYKGQAKNIELLFSHALSQVKFNVTMDPNTIDAANYTMVVNNISLEVPFDKNEISLATQSWGAVHSRSAGFHPYSGATNTGYYNVLPQSLDVTNSAKIIIDVTLTDNVTGEAYINGKLKPLVLDGTLAGFTQFENGKSYTFAVQIGSTTEDENGTPIFDPISFDSQLSTWDPTPVTVS